MDWSELMNRADFVGAAFGAFLGFLLALVVLLIDRWINWFQQLADKKRLFKDILTLVERETEAARDAEQGYGALAQAYAEKPLEMHPRRIHVNTGLRTLDRMDRERILAAYRRMAGRKRGWELWREALRFIDGLSAQYPYQEAAVLSSMEDMASVGDRYDAHCREVGLWLSTIGAELQTQLPAGHPLVARIHAIVSAVQNIGYVPMTELHERLILPVGELFRDGSLNLRNAFPLAEVFSKARADHGRYGQITLELQGTLKRFAKDMGETARDGECMRDRMKDALK